MNTQLTMLGTGSALVTHCFNTCFLLHTPETLLMVDAGGGNGILRQLEEAQTSITDIHHLFITHAHTDHLLGAVWLMRKVVNTSQNDGYDGTLTIYGHERVLHVLSTLAEMMMSKRDYGYVGRQIFFQEVTDNEEIQLNDLTLRFFDIHSNKEKQFGFRATLPDGRILCCLGDEPFQEECRPYAEGADWLLCEAFCLYSDRDRFHPYEKYHSTAKDAAQLAATLSVSNLLLYHTEDATLATRRQAYTAEVAQYFDGNIVVPNDLEVVEL